MSTNLEHRKSRNKHHKMKKVFFSANNSNLMMAGPKRRKFRNKRVHLCQGKVFALFGSNSFQILRGMSVIRLSKARWPNFEGWSRILKFFFVEMQKEVITRHFQDFFLCKVFF
uniref:(northern house mosquito) hypothetical protein n=1 Tax=Culex pipiens TaxID=7175 RepID=A0A8D8F9D0_CULPI